MHGYIGARPFLGGLGGFLPVKYVILTWFFLVHDESSLRDAGTNRNRCTLQRLVFLRAQTY